MYFERMRAIPFQFACSSNYSKSNCPAIHPLRDTTPDGAPPLMEVRFMDYNAPSKPLIIVTINTTILTEYGSSIKFLQAFKPYSDYQTIRLLLSIKPTKPSRDYDYILFWFNPEFGDLTLQT